MAPVHLCSICDKTFSVISSYRRHCRRHHPEQTPAVKKVANFKCAVCGDHIIRYGDLISHLLNSHDISLKTETFKFEDSSEFDKWKKLVEDTGYSLYVKKSSGSVLINKDRSVIFNCHRSGRYKPKVASSNRKRQLKTQGSSKINAYCPSRIKAIFSTNGRVSVEFISTHVGHEPDLAHLTLTTDDRIELAAQIASKIPFDEILENVHSAVADEDLKRKHLITRHDLSNIEREFKLVGESVKRSNDVMSVDTWVEKEMSGPSSCILMYKPQGVESSDKFPVFDRDDFVLGIMTQTQLEILQKFGSNCICVDSTHGLQQYGFEMTMLMVLDDAKQGFPCAFFISNRNDLEVIEFFFKSIRDAAGEINTKVFISVMEDVFYRAWISVMSLCEKRLYCPWHVDKLWRMNLLSISGTENQLKTYEQLKTLMQESDETIFLSKLQTVVDDLNKKEETEKFGKFLVENYLENWKFWAYCTRSKEDIDAYVRLENVSNTIKQLFVKGKTIKQLDKAIRAIIWLINSKLFDKLPLLEKGKITNKLREINVRHKKSLQMSLHLVTKTSDTCWVVNSSFSKGAHEYSINLVDPVCNCSLLCTKCDSCVHKFSCSCHDSCVKWNMCKHIHLVCRSLKPNHEPELVPLVDNVKEDEVYNYDDVEMDTNEFLEEDLCQCDDSSGKKEEGANTVVQLDKRENEKEAKTVIQIVKSDVETRSTLFSEPEQELVTAPSTLFSEPEQELVTEFEAPSIIFSEPQHELVTDFIDIVKELSTDEEISIVKNCLRSLVPLLQTIRNSSNNVLIKNTSTNVSKESA